MVTVDLQSDSCSRRSRDLSQSTFFKAVEGKDERKVEYKVLGKYDAWLASQGNPITCGK